MILSAEVGRQRQARDGLLAAVHSGEISRERLDQAVRNVLTVKARFGLLPGPSAQPRPDGRQAARERRGAGDRSCWESPRSCCPGAWPAAGPRPHARRPRPVGARQAQTVEVDIAGDVIVGRPTEITIRATNPVPDANQGSLTVSLPGNPNVEILGASTGGAKVFQPGEQMYNFGSGRNAADLGAGRRVVRQLRGRPARATSCGCA